MKRTIPLYLMLFILVGCQIPLQTDSRVLNNGEAGKVVGGQLNDTDRVLYQKMLEKDLSGSRLGDVISWENPETGHSGITRTIQIFTGANNRLCRRFRSTIVLESKFLTGEGVACKQPHGKWVVLTDGFS